MEDHSQATAGRPPLLELKEVGVEFVQPSRERLRLLEQVSLSIREDEIVAILGPSGSGKSTLVRVAAGLQRPGSGQVLYRGEPLLGPSPGVGVVFQNPALFPWLNVEQNIQLGLEKLGLPEERQREQVAWAVDTVGVDGYEEAYPRELSSGMKQRVGLARALALQPELLCLDDPFSALDALMAESLRNELLALWQRTEANPKAILMVTHNIQEVVFLASRILVLSGNPTRVKAEVHNNLAYPRDYGSPEFLDKVAQIHDIITKDILPDDAAASPGRFAQRLAPLPRADMGQVFGLLEALDDHQGRMDVFDFVSETRKEYSSVLMVVNAAEMLGLVRTPKDQVELTELGRAFLRGDVNRRKILLNQQLQGLRIYATVIEMVKRAEERELRREVVLGEFALLFPSEPANHLFNTMVNWGRFAELFGYSARKSLLYLDKLVASNGQDVTEYRPARGEARPRRPARPRNGAAPASGEASPRPPGEEAGGTGEAAGEAGPSGDAPPPDAGAGGAGRPG